MIAPGRVNWENHFYVVLHDVTPKFAHQVASIVKELSPLVGTHMAAAVVPRWHGRNPEPGDEQFARNVQRDFDELLLHGYIHRRDRGSGLVSLLTRSSDEFNGLSVPAAHRRLKSAQHCFSRMFGTTSRGFIAPTFQRGPLTASRLAEHGIGYYVGFSRVEFDRAGHIPLTTWCWDITGWRATGYLGDRLGHLLGRLRPSALRCLALHPADVDRGFHLRAARLVRSFLDQGRRPLLMSQLNSTSNTESTITRSD